MDIKHKLQIGVGAVILGGGLIFTNSDVLSILGILLLLGGMMVNFSIIGVGHHASDQG